MARPPVRSTGGRRASPKVLAIVVGAIAAAAVIAVGAIALVGHSSSSSSQTTTGALTTLPGASDVLAMFKGIPQHGNVLGSPKAPVTMVQYIDLQCPICRAFETEVMPTIVSRDVRNGKVKVVYRPIAFIGADSERGRRAALSVGLQNRLAQFSQLLYANQGTENSGWLTDDLVRAAYASIPGVNVQEAMNNRTSHNVLGQEQTFDTQATQDKVSGTPTVLIGRTGGKLVEVSPGTAPSISDLQNAINALEQQK
ncbi:MAG TPA: thioredoxin domain-containing protein [Gaiellaceae bacterium]|nr:thioredoxin domain-containing protein [Gaiellaceae bacterium]